MPISNIETNPKQGIQIASSADGGLAMTFAHFGVRISDFRCTSFLSSCLGGLYLATKTQRYEGNPDNMFNP
jgi:hypothetical protein